MYANLIIEYLEPYTFLGRQRFKKIRRHFTDVTDYKVKNGFLVVTIEYPGGKMCEEYMFEKYHVVSITCYRSMD